jgi:integrase
MASLFKMPGRPHWFVQVTLPNGERLPRKSTKETNKRDAERRAAEIESEILRDFKTGNLEQGRRFHRIVENAARLAEEGRLSITKAESFIRELRALANPDHQETSFRAFYTAWIATELSGLSESHISNHQGALKKWCAALGRLADAPLTEITVADLDAAFRIVRKGRTAGTANNHLSAIREVFKDAVRKRIIEHDPAALVKRLDAKKADKKTAKRGPFTVDEVRKIMAVAKDEWKGMILFGFHTSLRMMDIAGLTSANIDSGFLIVRSDKTDTATRTPLHPQLKAWLKGRSGAFFPNLAGKENSNVSQTFSNLMGKAKVEKEKTLPGGDKITRSFHSLRHTFTSVLADAGVDEETRMALTGQKDSTVHAAYTHHGDAKLKAAIKHLPKL